MMPRMLSFTLILMLAELAEAGQFKQTQILEPAGKQMGAELAFDGNQLLIGGSPPSPLVRYSRQDSASPWTGPKSISPPIKYPIRIAFSADTILIGDPGRTFADVSSAGVVRIFTYQEETWLVKQTLVEDPPRELGYFGVRLAADSGRLGVATSPSVGPAVVHSFARANGVWTHTGVIEPPNMENPKRFGLSISLSDDGMAITDGVSVHVYRFAENTWVREATLPAPDCSLVSLVKDRLAFSASYNGTKQVYVFRRGEYEWVEEGRISAGILRSFLFTYDHLFTTEFFAGYGRLRAFKLVNGKWLEDSSVVPDKAEADDLFGARILGDGETLMVSAYDHTRPTPGDSGVVYVFRYDDLPSEGIAAPPNKRPTLAYARPAGLAMDQAPQIPVPMPIRPEGNSEKIKPVFKWSAVPGATLYRVRVRTPAYDNSACPPPGKEPVGIRASDTTLDVPANDDYCASGYCYWRWQNMSRGKNCQGQPYVNEWTVRAVLPEGESADSRVVRFFSEQ